MPYLSLTPFSEVADELLDQIPAELDSAKDWLATVLNDSPSILDELFCAAYRFDFTGRGLDLTATVVAFTELSIPLPLLPQGTELVLASGEGETTEFRISVMLDFLIPGVSLSIYDIALALRFGNDILRAVDEDGDFVNGTSAISFEPAGSIYASYYVGKSFEIDFSGFDSIELSPSMIGDTGIIISATDIEANFSNKQLALGELTIKLPKDISIAPSDLVVRNAIIGDQGFSGEVGATWALEHVATHPENDGLVGKAVGSLFDSFSLGMRQLSITFDKNIPQEFEIQGLIVVPAFDNGAMETVINLGADGEIMVSLTGDEEGLLELTKDDLFKLRANSVSFKHTAQETGLTVSGALELTNDTVKDVIPKFGIEGFTAYKLKDKDQHDWKFRLEGGSVEINKSIDLFDVARADLKEIGLGEYNEWNAFTFSGGVQLLDGVDAGAWVEGLRIEWKKKEDGEGSPIEVGGLSLDGIGLLVVVPDTFEFQGSIVKKEAAGESYFEGAVNLNLLPVKMGLGAALKIGRNDNYTYAFLSADFCMPGPGIQLGALPLYIRCIGGLIGVNTTLDAEGIGQIFALALRKPAGLNDPSKWRAQLDSHAIGLIATISTAEPKLFTMESLLAFVYPELALLIEGQAFVLEDPTPAKEPPFHALMAFDIDEPSALLNVSAKYDFAKVLTIDDAMLEVYYGPDGSDSSDITYYFALGQAEKWGFPVDRPISTKALQLFSAMSYLILRPEVWALGATIGLPKKRIGFSMASVNFEAIIKGEGAIYWGPEQFKGSLSLSGNVGFRLFKKGFDLWLSANVVGMTPDWLVDALLKFGIKFKILWKKVKFEAKIPFHWERRITPPIPELLREILLQHPVTTKTQVPHVQRIADPLPPLVSIPQVEPDSIPALTFNYPINDRTGFPFGQDVSVYQDHNSGEYTFRATLPDGEPGSRGIEMYRMKITDYRNTDDPNSANWEGPFTADSNQSNGFLNIESPPTLYGAWQATKAPDGTGERTHLHLFARTPFEFSRPNRLDREIAQILIDETYESISNVSRLLTDDAPSVVNIPALKAHLRDFDELRMLNSALPFGPVQYVVNQEPEFPRSRTVGTTKKRLNFLLSRPGWYGREPIYMNGNSDSHLASVSDVVFQGFGDFEVVESGDPQNIELGNCEIAVDDSLPYPLPLLWIHDDRGLNEEERVVSGTLQNAEFEIALRHPVRQLTLYIDETIIVKDGDEYVEPISSLKFVDSYLRPNAITTLSQRGAPVEPPPTFDTSIAGQITISSDSQDSTFNHIVFAVHGDTRIYSLCYEIDYTEELDQREEQLTSFVDAIWPDGDDSDPEETQPDSGAPLVPGYVYKLEVRTSHERMRRSGGTRHDNYAAFFQISKPPTELTPYVLTTFPKANQFPHYRAEAYFVRFNRNYVQKLMGGQEHKLHWQLHKSAPPLSSLPYQDSNFGTFLQNRDPASPDNKGWGWGKANNHELTIQEKIWMKAYNKSASADQQIDENRLVPDDIIWVSSVNPILVRADFSQNSNDSIFQSVVGDGTPIGQWEIGGDSFLHHTPALSNAETSERPLEANSFLLTTASVVPPYLLSVWLRPHADTPGHVGIILAANNTLTRYLMLDLNPATQRVSLMRKDMTQNPDNQVRIWAEKPIGLGSGRWSRLFVRVVSVSDQLTVTLEFAGQILFSVTTDLASSHYLDEETYVGLFASADYRGVFDNFEVLSVDLLNELPLGGESHHLALYYQDEDENSEMYRMTALASHYIDLFDHLNSWDRNIGQSQGTAKGDADILGAVHEWEQKKGPYLLTLGEIAADEQQHAANLRTSKDLDDTSGLLREERYNLDVSFNAVAEALGLELPIRPKRLAFIRADAGKALFIQSPEPIDWTRLAAGSAQLVEDIVDATPQQQSIDTQLIYNSEMTCAILILPSDASINAFGLGQTYVWTIMQYHGQLPTHLNWLQPLLTHQKKEYQLTLAMP